ncbi:MAG: hypothetical protein EBS53_19080, partial [Bacteroidetes bacterium]|nr:hypothetical protein [Bacteroidota bacterium]
MSAPSDTLLARDYKGIGNQDLESGRLLVPAIPIHDQATRNAGKRGDKQDGKGNGLGVGKPGDPCPTLTKGDKHAVLYENHPNDSRVTGPHEVAPACVSRFGTGGGNVPLVQESIPFRDPSPTLTNKMQGQAGWAPYNEDAHLVGVVPLVQEAVVFQASELRLSGKITEQKVCPTLKANTKAGDTEPRVIAFEPGIATRERKENRFIEEMSPTLRKEMGDNQVAVAVDVYNQKIDGDTAATLTKACGGSNTSGAKVMNRMAVRRLTPKECE